MDFIRGKKELCGTVPWAEMSRLRDVLANSEFNIANKLDFAVRGYLDQANRPTLALTLNGSCHLRCQRCMQPVMHSANLTKLLLLVAPSVLNDLPIADEPAEIDYIPVNEQLDVMGLVEEEFLLSLPFAPKHDTGTCDMSISGLETNPGERNPFAVLANLKLR